MEARSLRTTRRAVLALLLSVTLTAAVPAWGAPIDDRRADAVRIKAQIDSLDEQLEIAAEDYNEARGRYNEVSARVAEAEMRLAELTARQVELETSLSTRVTGMYRQGPLGALEMLLGAASFQEFASTWDLLQDLNETDAGRVAQLKVTRVEIETVRSELVTQQTAARAEADVMRQRESEVRVQLAERQRLLSGVEAEIAALERDAREADRRRAAAAAAAARVTADYAPPTNAPRSEVVKIALSKLGSPYRWAASGPDAFDCSGFTMWVYARVGVSLPHSSRAQIGYGQRVSKADLKPGDLVFFGRSTIHHVGIYIGGGDYVHSPNTGDVVKVSSLSARTDYVGACRP